MQNFRSAAFLLAEKNVDKQSHTVTSKPNEVHVHVYEQKDLPYLNLAEAKIKIFGTIIFQYILFSEQKISDLQGASLYVKTTLSPSLYKTVRMNGFCLDQYLLPL